jgi:hypothetical protein
MALARRELTDAGVNPAKKICWFVGVFGATYDLATVIRDYESARDGAGKSHDVGTAIETKDWGSDNWVALTKALADRARGYGLAMVGAADDFQRAELVRRGWAGPSVNLCGKLTVRLSSAVMELASLYVGHDSGPMHLAAAAGIPCVSIFSARIKAGIWFPYGTQHQVLYHDVPCSNCDLDTCQRYQKRCIASITVDEVTHAADKLLLKSDSCAGPSGATAAEPPGEQQVDVPTRATASGSIAGFG